MLCGDGELAEGSIWEALDKASYYDLSNLVAIFDVNRLGQRGETDLGWDIDRYAARAEAFGARTLVIDGHDLAAIDEAMAIAGGDQGDRPTVIVAKTIKGAGYSEVADSPGWHGKPLPADMSDRAIRELGGERFIQARGPLPEPATLVVSGATAAPAESKGYEVGEKVATRRAYGDGIVAVGGNDPRIVALDAEVSNSTHADLFKKAYPDRFFEMFIAEQQMIAAATGLSVRGYKPFASTFAAFLTRAFDFIRMGAVSGVDLRLSGSPCRCGDRPRRSVADGAGGPGHDASGARIDSVVSQ